jgi:hypothetical protein
MADEHTCIVLRLRRTIVEDAYVAVPVTDAIMNEQPEPDGSYRINFDAFVREAVRLSSSESVDWAIEEQTAVAHPTQQPIPDGRRVFDVHRQVT